MSVYEIRVEGCLNAQWSTWFDGLAITDDTPTSTLLRGELLDESALHGVLTKLNALNLRLHLARRIDADTDP